MHIHQKIENDFHILGRPCGSCGRKPFLVLAGKPFVTCTHRDCERFSNLEVGNAFDYGETISRALRAWEQTFNRPISYPRSYGMPPSHFPAEGLS